MSDASQTVIGAVRSRLANKKVLIHGRFDYYRQRHYPDLVTALGGTLADDLDATVGYVVLPDLGAAKGVQQKVASLNKNGASIAILDAAGFDVLATLTADEVLALIRAGRKSANLFQTILMLQSNSASGGVVAHAFRNEKFDGLDLSRFNFEIASYPGSVFVTFSNCSFAGCLLGRTRFSSVVECDFSDARGEGARFGDVSRSKFVGADLAGVSIEGDLDGADFSAAMLRNATISDAPSKKPGTVSRFGRMLGKQAPPGA